MKINEAWDALINLGISDQTLQIVTSGWGYTMETLETVLYAETGLNSFDQLTEEE